MLKSRVHHPPGGFKFYQPETDWNAPEWLSFTGLVEAVIMHRQANPRFNLATDRARVEYEVDTQNASRLKAMAGCEDFIAGDTAPPPFQFPPRQKRDRGGGAVLGSAKRAAAGVGAIMDWLGAGLEPVSKELAEARATTCVRCPLNVLGNFWQRLEGKAAEAVRELVNAKNEMDLSTTVDAQLHVCGACDCFLPLKVHVPFRHIMAHTSEETFNKLDPGCWIRQERA